MLEITKYQTSDGKEFSSIKAAEDHEAFLHFVADVDTSGIYWRDTSAREVAEWFWRTYNLTKK